MSITIHIRIKMHRFLFNTEQRNTDVNGDINQLVIKTVLFCSDVSYAFLVILPLSCRWRWHGMWPARDCRHANERERKQCKDIVHCGIALLLPTECWRKDTRLIPFREWQENRGGCYIPIENHIPQINTHLCITVCIPPVICSSLPVVSFPLSTLCLFFFFVYLPILRILLHIFCYHHKLPSKTLTGYFLFC